MLFPTRNPITDLHFHGTHVATTVSSNALAAAGMTSGVTLIGVKVLDRTGSGPFSAIFNGMLWAADHGADVINMPLGTDFPARPKRRVPRLLQPHLQLPSRKGTIIVVAAGNDSIDLDHDGNNFNANCNAPNVVCVSATSPTASASTNGPWTNVDAPAFYTNFGRSAINVAGPGGNIGPGGTGGFVWEVGTDPFYGKGRISVPRAEGLQ